MKYDGPTQAARIAHALERRRRGAPPGRIREFLRRRDRLREALAKTSAAILLAKDEADATRLAKVAQQIEAELEQGNVIEAALRAQAASPKEEEA